MHRRSQNDKHVEYLMRAPPDVKASGVEPFRKPDAIDEGTDEDHATLGVVVRKTGLFVELIGREQRGCVDDGRKGREAGQYEDR